MIMTEEQKVILKDILGNFSSLDYINPEDVPDIPLYMG